ncbi:MAG: cell wall-binding repeat-containing protein [Acidimicrobiia bacterium]|nr:MAG: cell wall-binding repeat-containing protein [Acidimicrobiia bacterium]
MSAVPTRRELIAWLAAFTLLITVVVGLRMDEARSYTVGPSTAVAYVATGANYPDALAASSAAALGLGPVLLTEKDSIPSATMGELTRLDPQKIYLMGGTAVISSGVESQLVTLFGAGRVERISGNNRYETAAALSAATFPTSGLYPRAAYAANDSLPDGTGGESQILLTLNIDAPSRGYLLIDAGADAYYGPALASRCWVAVDSSAPVTGSVRYFTLNGSLADNGEEDCTTEVGEIVDAGTHVVTFRTNAAAGVKFSGGALTVLWVPFGPFGERP